MIREDRKNRRLAKILQDIDKKLVDNMCVLDRSEYEDTLSQTTLRSSQRIMSPPFSRKEASPILDLSRSPTSKNLNISQIHTLDMQSKYEELRHQYHLLQNQLTRANSKLRLYVVKEAQDNAQKQKQQKQIEILVDYVEQLESKIQDLQSNLNQSAKFMQNTENPEIIRKTDEQLLNKLAELERDNQRKIHIIQKLQKQSMDRYLQDEQYENNIYEYRLKTQELGQQVENLKFECTQKHSQVQMLQQQLNECRNRLHISNSHVQKSQIAVVEQQKKTNFLMIDIERLKQDLNRLRMESQDKYRYLYQQMQEKDKQLNQLHRYVGQLQQLADKTPMEAETPNLTMTAIQTEVDTRPIETQTENRRSIQKVQSETVRNRQIGKIFSFSRLIAWQSIMIVLIFLASMIYILCNL